MPKERLSMRKIKEVLRLRWGCGLSQRQIAESCSIARSTVGEYVLRAQAAGLEWPLPEDLDWRSRRGLDKSLPATLASCEWVGSRLNLTCAGSRERIC